VRGPVVYLQIKIEKKFKCRMQKRKQTANLWKVMYDKCKLK